MEKDNGDHKTKFKVIILGKQDVQANAIHAADVKQSKMFANKSQFVCFYFWLDDRDVSFFKPVHVVYM